MGCWGRGVCLLCGSLWIAYLGFFFFFQLVASFLVELKATMMVVVVWLCRGFYFCGCRLIFLGSCELILVVVVVEELAVGNGSGVGCMKWWWQWWDVLFYCSKYIILL